MPPKVRGGGRGRGRGGATRGGAGSSSARSDATSPTAAPPDLKTETSIAHDDSHGQPVSQESNVPAAIESQGTNEIPSASSTSSPQTATDSPARPPVQRLDSLKSTEPASRSASPSTVRRTASARGKRPAAIKPTFTARRSKQDRDALDKIARDREKERQAERLAEERQKEKDNRKRNREAQRGNNIRGRGGYSGSVSGPFSLGNAAHDRRSTHRGTISGSRATQVKREDHDDEGGAMKTSRGTTGTSVKREDGGYVSSSSDEDDEEAGIARRNIDQIEISSDEEESEQGPSNRAERSQRSHGASALLPVRILRKEHTERTFGINTDASSEAAAKILQQAEASGTEVKVEMDEKATRKGKGKVKDVEITGVRKPYKGMWQDGDDEDVRIKEEAASDDEDMADALAVGISEPTAKEPVKASISSPDTEKKPKARGKAGTEPVMQTDEERAEYDRYLRNLEAIRGELGPEIEEADAAGDSSMQDAGVVKRTVRDNNAYLFQFPPRMPGSRNQDIKKEPTESTQGISAPTGNGGAKTIKTEDTKEEDEKPKRRRMPVVSGIVGKVRVHQSGRTTFRWGGETFDLTPGNPAGFMQEVLEVEDVPPSMRVIPNEGGYGTSFGRVKGKFVVTPSWKTML